MSAKRGFAPTVPIVIIVLIVVAGFLFASKNISRNVNNVTSLENTEDTIIISKGVIKGEDEPSGKDYSGIKPYKVNLQTKELSSYDYPENEIKKYSGIPFVNNDKFATVLVSYLYSQDEREVLVWIGTKNHSEPVDEGYMGYYINEKSPLTYRCSVNQKTCHQVETIPLTNQVNTSERYYTGAVGFWMEWNNKTGQLFGYPHGEGGPTTPVSIYDTRSSKTYNIIESDGKINLWFARIDSSFERVFAVTSESGSRDVVGKVYERDGESFKLVKTINLSSINSSPIRSDTNESDYLRTAQWVANQPIVMIRTSRKIYSYNTVSGELIQTVDASQALNIQKQIQGKGYEITKEVNFSPSGRYIYFVKYESPGTPNEMATLKVIDLQNNNKVIDIASDNYLSIR